MGSDQTKANKAASKSHKKALKQAAKEQKKAPNVTTKSAARTASTSSEPTPAERSAAASELNAAINRRRLLIQIIGAILALAAILVTWKTRQVVPQKAPTAAPDSVVTTGDL